MLLQYTILDPTPLEEIESVDMNRLLEHGYKVKMVKTTYQTFAVDTIVDLENVQEKMIGDSLIKDYS